MRQSPQHLRHARRVFNRPEQIAPLFDHGICQRIEKPSCRQVHLL